MLKLDSAAAFERTVEEAGLALSRGVVIALVTDTVYGLAADRDNPAAMKRLIELKQRPPDQPFTVLLADAKDLDRFDVQIGRTARKLCEVHWPGPLTIVLPSPKEGTLGFRVPDHAAAAAIVRRSGVCVAAPSANPHGQPPALSAQEVLRYYDGALRCVVDGGRAAVGRASTVVAFEGEQWEILREGALPRSEIRRTVNVNVLFVCEGNTCRSPLAAALFRKLLAARLGVIPDDLEDRGFTVESCGMAASPGMRVSEYAEDVAREAGLDLSAHRSQEVSLLLLKRADVIFTMTRRELENVLARLPEASRTARMIDTGGDIPDPIGGSLPDYHRLMDRFRKLLPQAVEEITRT
ncbi:MAG: L-threonylcarbamoyladenylate synthase [Planctomycetota bacterium]